MASVQAMLSGGVGPHGSTEAAQVAEIGTKALAVLRKTISVDVLTHVGPQSIYSPAPPNGTTHRQDARRRTPLLTPA